MYMCETLCHEPCLVLIQHVVELVLSLVNTLGADYLALWWSIHKVPSVILRYGAIL